MEKFHLQLLFPHSSLHHSRFTFRGSHPYSTQQKENILTCVFCTARG